MPHRTVISTRELTGFPCWYRIYSVGGITIPTGPNVEFETRAVKFVHTELALASKIPNSTPSGALISAAPDAPHRVPQRGPWALRSIHRYDTPRRFARSASRCAAPGAWLAFGRDCGAPGPSCTVRRFRRRESLRFVPGRALRVLAFKESAQRAGRVDGA